MQQDPDEEIQDYAPVQELQAIQQDEEDRLSALPTEILFQILTLVRFKDIFRASTLSRSWRNLNIPTVIPLLDFRHRSTIAQDSPHVRQFFDSIKDALRERGLYIIAGFCIDFPFHSRYQDDVVLLIHEALKWKVKNLNIIFTNGEVDERVHDDASIRHYFHFFLLPAFLYENPFLEMLSFSMCSFDNLLEIKWYFLKELKIGNTCLTSGNSSVVKKIVSGCPLLEVLELNHCCGFKSLNFNNHAKLKKLVVNRIWYKAEDDGLTFLSISAPTVRILELLGDFVLKIVRIKHMNSCVEAKLDYHMVDGELLCCINHLRRSLNNLTHVQTLICGTWIIETISWNCRKGFPLELRECKSLTLHSPLLHPYQLGILRLLQSCQNTEELIIHAARSSPLCEEHRSVSHGNIHGVKYKTTPNSKLWGFSFKTLNVTNFGGRHFANEISFLNFILENARHMEYMVIDYDNDP